MKRHAENVLEDNEQTAICSVEQHSGEKGPFLTLAREMPEEDKHAGYDAVDDQVEYHAGGADTVRDRIYDLRDAESDDEVNFSASHPDDGVE